jgi:hypothetical protein
MTIGLNRSSGNEELIKFVDARHFVIFVNTPTDGNAVLNGHYVKTGRVIFILLSFPASIAFH